jgi:hypothetical protein
MFRLVVKLGRVPFQHCKSLSTGMPELSIGFVFCLLREIAGSEGAKLRVVARHRTFVRAIARLASATWRYLLRCSMRLQPQSNLFPISGAQNKSRNYGGHDYMHSRCHFYYPVICWTLH